MALESDRTINLTGLQKFVMQRLQKEGGFAATPLQPHTIQDTFYAVAILRYLATKGQEDLSASLAVDATGRYLQDYGRRHQSMPAKTAFQLMRLAQWLGLSIPLHWRSSTKIDDRADYEESWYAAVLDQRKKVSCVKFCPKRWTVKQLCYYLKLQSVVRPGQVPPESEKLEVWIRRCQAPDGGFGFFPHTTSYIENCHYALAALALLDSRPARPAQAAAFILSCQTAAGGFSRNSKAAPFLDASWHAVQALHYLALVYRIALREK